jgi:hypothetical protein
VGRRGQAARDRQTNKQAIGGEGRAAAQGWRRQPPVVGGARSKRSRLPSPPRPRIDWLPFACCCHWQRQHAATALSPKEGDAERLAGDTTGRKVLPAAQRPSGHLDDGPERAYADAPASKPWKDLHRCWPRGGGGRLGCLAAPYPENFQGIRERSLGRGPAGSPCRIAIDRRRSPVAVELQVLLYLRGVPPGLRRPASQGAARLHASRRDLLVRPPHSRTMQRRRCTYRAATGAASLGQRRCRGVPGSSERRGGGVLPGGLSSVSLSLCDTTPKLGGGVTKRCPLGVVLVVLYNLGVVLVWLRLLVRCGLRCDAAGGVY